MLAHVIALELAGWAVLKYFGSGWMPYCFAVCLLVTAQVGQLNLRHHQCGARALFGSNECAAASVPVSRRHGHADMRHITGTGRLAAARPRPPIGLQKPRAEFVCPPLCHHTPQSGVLCLVELPPLPAPRKAQHRRSGPRYASLHVFAVARGKSSAAVLCAGGAWAAISVLSRAGDCGDIAFMCCFWTCVDADATDLSEEAFNKVPVDCAGIDKRRE